jgi:hypothetical protein
MLIRAGLVYWMDLKEKRPVFKDTGRFRPILR